VYIVIFLFITWWWIKLFIRVFGGESRGTIVKHIWAIVKRAHAKCGTEFWATWQAFFCRPAYSVSQLHPLSSWAISFQVNFAQHYHTIIHPRRPNDCACIILHGNCPGLGGALSQQLATLGVQRSYHSASVSVQTIRRSALLPVTFHFSFVIIVEVLPSALRHRWLGVGKIIRPVKFQWWGIGVVICLERGADCLHMVQLMSLPSRNPITSCLV